MEYSPKSYEITYEERPRYLFAQVRANEIDREIALSYFRDLAAKCKALGKTRLMVDRRIPAVMSDAENYLFMLELGTVLGETRLALVNPFLANEDTLNFAALVGENRGFPYRAFSSEAEAEKWLLNEEP